MDCCFKISGFADEIDPDINKQFEHLNKLGIKYFEVRGVNGKNISKLTDSEVESLKDAMKSHILPLLLLPFVLLTAALCLAVLLGGQDFVHALLNVAVLP